MSDSKRNANNVVLDMRYGGHGELLKEVVRATMHGGNPSAVLHTVIQGMAQYRHEVGQAMDKTDGMLLAEVLMKLHTLHTEVLDREEQVYLDTSPKP